MNRIYVLLSALALTGCVHRPVVVSKQISGGETIRLYKIGKTFSQAENDRIAVSDSGLQTVLRDGKPYVRWTFTLRLKQPADLHNIRVEEVTANVPVLLLNDASPQQDAGRWTRTSGLMELSSTAIPWLFDPGTSVLVIRFTVTEVDARRYAVYQGVEFTSEAKRTIRRQVGQ